MASFFLCTVAYLSFALDPEDPYKISDKTRSLGLVVCRGSAVMCLYPTDGMEEIANPFQEIM